MNISKNITVLQVIIRVLSIGNRTQWGQGGNVKEGLKLTPMSSFDVEQGGVNLDLEVVEFWSGCRQIDLASACVLHPLNRLVLDFVVWSWVGEEMTNRF